MHFLILQCIPQGRRGLPRLSSHDNDALLVLDVLDHPAYRQAGVHELRVTYLIRLVLLVVLTRACGEVLRFGVHA